LAWDKWWAGMARLNYETADTLVFDPVTSHRNATRAVLYTLGFRNIVTVPTLDAFNEAIWKSTPDLALCEAQGADTGLCDMIQQMRQGHSGHANPFLVIIVTAWEKTHTLVSRVLNSGADDLILRPFSTNLLRARIDAHVERRKHFVITHDYVGPDRRNDPARPNSAEPFLPPNSLKMKVKDGLSVTDAQDRLTRELRTAKDTLNTEKLRRDAFQICVLWRLLQEPEDTGTEMNLAKLANLTQGIAKRCRSTEYEGAGPWCESLLAAVEGLHFGVDRNASMHLLGHAALSLNQVLQPDLSKSDHLKLIEETVTMIRARSVGRSSADDPLLTADSA
jgi:DNA-binding response OmpR family regulator